MKKRKKRSTFSEYTIARNCADLDDVAAGLQELNEYKENHYRKSLNISSSIFGKEMPCSRLWYKKKMALEKRRKQLEKRK